MLVFELSKKARAPKLNHAYTKSELGTKPQTFSLKDNSVNHHATVHAPFRW